MIGGLEGGYLLFGCEYFVSVSAGDLKYDR